MDHFASGSFVVGFQQQVSSSNLTQTATVVKPRKAPPPLFLKTQFRKKTLHSQR